MIDITALPLGTVFYNAVENNDFFKQTRIYMTDGVGQEWYRYDRDRYSYKVDTLTYVGSVQHVVIGEISSDERTATEYYVKTDTGHIFSYTADEELFTDSFLSYEQAEQQTAQWQQQRKSSEK